jgi:uncharacterized membrane protein
MNNSRWDRNGGNGGNGDRGAWDRVGDLEPWLSVVSGGALALYGLGRLLGGKKVSGGMLATAGSALVYRGVTSERSFEPVHVERGYTIMKPVEEVYRFWRNFENFPRFMSHLESVVVTDRWSHWVARGPMGTSISWHAEIIDEQPNRYIIWQSKPDSMVDTRGSVQFRQAPGDRGTEVFVAMDYRPPAGRVGDALAMMLGHSAEQKIREDLRHMKQLLEAGEIPTTEGQSHGERSFIGKFSNWATAEPRRGGVELVEEEQPA